MTLSRLILMSPQRRSATDEKARNSKSRRRRRPLLRRRSNQLLMLLLISGCSRGPGARVVFQGQPRWSSAPRRHSSKAKSIRWRPQAVLRHAVKLRWPALLLVAFWVRWTLCAPQKWLGAMEPRPACLPPCCRLQSVRGLHPHHHVCSPNILGIRFRREEREGPLHIAGGYRKRFSLLRGGNTERHSVLQNTVVVLRCLYKWKRALFLPRAPQPLTARPSPLHCSKSCRLVGRHLK